MRNKFFAALLCLSLAVWLVGISVTPSEAVTKSDIVFFIDSSGSMSPYIESVRTNLNSFSASLAEQGIDARFAIVQYEGSLGILPHKMDDSGNTWTSDPSRVSEVLGYINAGGWDGSALDAAGEVSEWSTFRSGALRYVFLLTNDDTRFSDEYIDDIDIHYDDNGKYTNFTLKISDEGKAYEDEIINKLKDSGITLSVISNSYYREVYNKLFNGTGGVFADISRPDFYQSMLDIARWIGEDSSISSSDRLPYAVIEAVPSDVLYYVSDDETGETVLERIARLVNITSSEINVITYGNISDYNLSLPHEPTASMKKQADGEFIAKLDTITLYSDFLSKGQQGYYLFQINVPDELLSNNVTIDNWKFWYATPEEFTAAETAMFRAAATGLIDFWIFDQMGMKINTPVKKVLALVFGNTGDSLALFILKGVVSLLTGGLGGGCNTGGLAGSGLAGLVMACAVVTLRKRFRK